MSTVVRYAVLWTLFLKLSLCFSSWDQPPKIAWQFHSRVSQLTCIRSKWVRQPDYNFTANALWWNNVQNPNSLVRTEDSVSMRAHLCLSSRISKRAYVLSSNHWNSACFHASPMFTQCGRISTLTRYPCHTSTTTSICLIFSSPFLSLSRFLQTIAIHTPDNVM